MMCVLSAVLSAVEARAGLPLLPVLPLHCVSGALAGLVPTSSCLSGSAQCTERGLHLSEAWVAPFPLMSSGEGTQGRNHSLVSRL